MKFDQTISFEARILTRVIQRKRASLPKAAAKAMLEFQFPESDVGRMHELAEKNQEGKLTRSEGEELEAYLRVGRLLDLLSAQARLALSERHPGA
jgi:hypothetical protein